MLAVAELVEAVQLPHRVIRRTTVGRLRAAGFEVVRSGPEHHVTIRLRSPFADIGRELEALASAFAPSEAKPVLSAEEGP